MFRIACPGCGAVYAIDPAAAGKTGTCPHCRAQFTLPSPDAPPLVASTAAVEVEPCPGCGARLSVRTADVGGMVECPQCRAAFRAKRARRRDDEDDDRPSRRRSSRRYDEDDDEEDDYDPGPRRPGELGSVGGMLLGGGIVALLWGAYLLLTTICLWPGAWLAVVWGVLAVARGSRLLNPDDRGGPPTTLCVLQIALVINCDIPNLVMGIVGLVQLNSPGVRRYYERRQSYEG